MSSCFRNFGDKGDSARAVEQVLRKRPYIQREWCEDVLAAPIRREVQSDGRIRLWGRVAEASKTRFLRVVTLEDGETVHNAFFDRNFREE